MRRVVITGMGTLSPIGNDLNSFEENLFKGTSGSDMITRFDATHFPTRFACEVKDLDIGQFMSHREARRLDPFTIYALIVADEAIRHSGLDMEQIDKDLAGVIWGSGIGGFKTIEDSIEEEVLSKSEIPRYNPFMIPKLIADIAPGHISIKYGLRSVNYATVSACASASHAICNSFDMIQLGRADVMITGGSEAAVTKAGIGGFCSMKALSKRNDDPKTASRPFDKERDGFVLGEGGAALVLEELEHAKKRGANIIAEVAGVGMSADAYHITAPHPEGAGASLVMRKALNDANLNTSDIDYINVHGTSTPLGDIAETLAILNVFKEESYKLNISSTKSMTGHLLGAAGAIEAVASVLAIQNSAVPPTINHFTDDPEIDPKLNLTFHQTQERKVDAVVSNTFGFGGHNSSIIIKRYDA